MFFESVCCVNSDNKIGKQLWLNQILVEENEAVIDARVQKKWWLNSTPLISNNKIIIMNLMANGGFH
jgi:hypothetical protein